MICVCLATRYPKAVLLMSVTSTDVSEALLEVICRQGVPEVILTDQGPQFVGSLVPALCAGLGINNIKTTPYHPQGNGAVERLHQTLCPTLLKACHGSLDWPPFVKYCLFLLYLPHIGALDFTI